MKNGITEPENHGIKAHHVFFFIHLLHKGLIHLKNLPSYLLKTQILKRLNTEAVARRRSVKKVFLEILQNSQENTCVGGSFFNKVAGLKLATLFKKSLSLAQVFSCEFCEISKNTFFHRTPPVAASENSYLGLLIVSFILQSVKVVHFEY